jgi:hypothetical protein
VSHLAFVDDLMLFSRANPSEASSLLESLNKYTVWSGKAINFTTSAPFFKAIIAKTPPLLP